VREIKDIPVSQIVAGQYETRMDVDNDSLDDLVASIRRVGILCPLHVLAKDDLYTLVAGHRRLAAARVSGLSTVPCIILDSSSSKPSEVSFAENLFRRDLTPVELASSMKDCIEQGIMGLPELASALHRSEEWVRRYLAILSWPQDVQKAVHEGWLSVSAASNLACVRDDSYREFLLSHACQSGATARLTAAWLQAWEAMQPPEAALASGPVSPGERPVPLVPQAPCIMCGNIMRTDELCHVPCCASCIRKLREIVR